MARREPGQAALPKERKHLKNNKKRIKNKIKKKHIKE